jgi:ring-1,2-phenylacetyl-CoA epoxidase subunit PaaD
MVKQVDEQPPADDSDKQPRRGAPALEDRIHAVLATVHDPEIPPLSIVDLGIVERVTVTDDEVRVDLVPTFAGCPALDVIRDDVAAAVEPLAHGRAVEVRFVYAPPWTSDRITDAGRAALLEYGLTPPPDRRTGGPVPIGLGMVPEHAVCPFCGSPDTVVESRFGPTLCRSIHFCRACRNPFEAFKPKLPAPANP